MPKADQRAIRDYVSDFSADLLDLPPLAFVLIIGGTTASTVPAKLTTLEAEAGVPVKFMPTSLVAKLRHALPGPLLPKQFRDTVVKSDPVLDDSLVEIARDGLAGLEAVHANFVDGLKAISRS